VAVSSTPNPFVAAMKARGYTQASLAERVGVTRAHVSKVAAGRDSIRGLRPRLLELGFTEAELVVPGAEVQATERTAAALELAGRTTLADVTVGDLVRASRKAQGLPDKLTEPDIVQGVARILAFALLNLPATDKARR
jgi:transcriptional regulator with XRE-family HTH domain